jgi:hypothetical protein
VKIKQVRSGFDEFLHEQVTYGRRVVQRNGYLDERTGGPRLDILIPKIERLEPTSVNHGDEAFLDILAVSGRAAIANEVTGNIEAALGWYKVGQYRWRSGYRFEGDSLENDAPLTVRDDAARFQLPAAVSSDRVGDVTRAKTLYTWASENRKLTDDEINHYLSSKQESVVWQRLPYRAYAFACMDRWEEALQTCQKCTEVVSLDPDTDIDGTNEEHLKILVMVEALCRFRLSPDAETRGAVIRSLHPQFASSTSHVDHLDTLFYLYNLRARHPDLANPDPDELPPAARARQGYEACISWMAHGGLQLDGTIHSLEVIDQHLAEVWNAMDHGQHKMVLFLVGSYVGEVIREELAGGEWNFTEEDMLAWTLDWEMGEAELQVHPYLHIRQMVDAESTKPLVQLWQEAEMTYIELGLATGYSD